MKSVFGAGACTAAILAFAIAAYADTTGQSPSQPAGQSSSQPSAQQPADRPAQPSTSAAQQPSDRAEQVTVIGCVQREADYRKAQGAGQGGAANTGVGAGNEFVLINASTSTSTASSSTPSSTAGTAGTAGTAPSAPGTSPGAPSTAGSPSTSGAGAAFELTGPGEGQLDQYVGKRVEISGKLKAAKGVRPSADPMGKDLNLRELEVTSVKESTGTCPASPAGR